MGSMFPNDSAWKPVAVGAGGWITGIDIAKDGTMIARADTYGAFIWNGSAWQQLVTAATMPNISGGANGVYEIRIAQSNSQILYMQFENAIYKSVDQGHSWAKTAFPGAVFDGNGANRMDGQKMAIDPNNPNIVFAGTQKDGLWVTRDGGSNWQKVAAVPQGSNTTDPGLTGIIIQGNDVYVGTAGAGVYQSRDGGYTWKAIGGPADISHAAIAPNGTYYATGNTDTALWKFANGAWTKLAPSGVHSIAIDPFNAAHLIVTDTGGNIIESKDSGASWGADWNWGKQLESSNDVPWLENSGLFMSTGGLVFDPLVPGKLWQSGGVGVWHTELPANMLWNTAIVWNSQSVGIEQLVGNEIVAAAGSDPLFASWDRAFISLADVDQYATSYSGGAFSMGWSVDYASTDPRFMVGISDYWGTENSGFSVDGGKTWSKFAGMPTFANNTIGGSIAASTSSNFIWVASGNQAPAYTLDGGKTWSNVSIAGISDWSQVHGAYYLNRTTVAADRVSPNTFYLYDTSTGVYRTTDGGATWTKMFSGQVADWSYWNAKIEAVPGQAGELFFTSGPLGSDLSNPDFTGFMHSVDGGATWKAVTGVGAATFGFGAPAKAGGPATIFIVGTVNGVEGIFYSADDAQSWVKIGERPMNSLDIIKTISGDMDQFGLVYVGFAGSGYAYLDFSGGAPTPPAPTPPPGTPAPSQIGVIDAALDDVGASTTVKSGAVVNDPTPTLSGTLSAALNAGQKLSVYRDGQLIGQVSPASTSWSFTDPGAGSGKHDYVVRVVDALGQTGAASGSFALTVDTVAPNQSVTVSSVSSSAGTAVADASLMKMSLAAGSGTTMVSGNVDGTLGADESVVVFRDGVRLGVAAVSNGAWSFNDGVTSGTFKYTAQVQDAAGNLGKMSDAFAVQLGLNTINGTARNDALMGTSGSDLISGVPDTGPKIGKGTIDMLTGGAGDDIFVLGDSRGRFYDDGLSRSSGTADFARITDFSEGDRLQLKGSASEYLQGWINNVQGWSGTGIYHDSNGNGVLDSRDELIALVQNHGQLDLGSFLFI